MERVSPDGFGKGPWLFFLDSYPLPSVAALFFVLPLWKATYTKALNSK